MKKNIMITIILFMFILLSMSVSAVVNSDNLMYYWKMNDCSENIKDSAKVYDKDLIRNGDIGDVSGIVGGACEFSASTTFLKSTSITNASGIRTMEYWIYTKTGTPAHHPLTLMKSTGWGDPQIEFQSTGSSLVSYVNMNGFINAGYNVMNVTFDNWNHVVYVFNGTHHLVFKNGINTYTDTSSELPNDILTYLGTSRRPDNQNTGEYLKGYIDNVAIWDYPFTLSDAIAHYNSSNGIDYLPDLRNVDITYPSEDIGITTTPYILNVTFNTSGYDNGSMSCYFYKNLTLINSNLSITPLDYNNIFTDTFYNDTNISSFFYKVLCNDTEGSSSDNVTINILVDTSEPIINISLPNKNNSSFYFINEMLNIDISFSDDNLYNTSITIYNSSNDILYSNISEIVNTTTYNYTDSINTSILGHGKKILSAVGYDGHTKKDIDFDKWGMTKSAGSIDFGNCRIYTNINENQILDYSYDCKDDRCSWTYDFTRNVNNLKQYISCDEPISHITNSDYLGHLVSGNNWIDAENDNGLIPKVTRINSNIYLYDYSGQSLTRLTTKSIGELNRNEKNVTFDVYDYDSSEGISFDVDPFILGNPSYILVDNFTFEVLSDRHIDFFGDGNVYKASNPQTTDVWLAINISGAGDYVNEQVSSVGFGDYRSFTISRFHDNFTAGNYSIEIYMRETDIGSIGVSSLSVYGLTDETQHGNVREHEIINYVGNLTSTSYVNILNTTIEYNNTLSKVIVDIDMKHKNFGTSDVLKQCYIESFATSERSPVSFRSNDGGTETGSSGFVWVFDPTNTTDHTFGLWCRDSSPVPVEYRITGLVYPQSFNSHLIVNSFIESEEDVVNLSSGRHLLVSGTMESKHSTTTGLTTYTFIESLSGGQTFSVWTNSSRCPELKHHYRSTDVTGEIAAIKYTTICNQSIIGENTTFYTWLDISVGESVSVKTSAIGGLEFDTMNTSEIQIPPIVGFFDSPLENLNYSGSVNITWEEFSDPNGDTVTYWLNATVDNGTIVILENYSGTLTSYIFNDNLNENISLILIGCDDTGLCSVAEEVTFYNEDVLPIVTITSIPSNSYLGENNISIYWTYNDNNPGTGYIDITYPSGIIILNSSSLNGSLNLTTFDLTETGDYRINVHIVDDIMVEYNYTDTFSVTERPIFGDVCTLGEFVCRIPETTSEGLFLFFILAIVTIFGVMAVTLKARFYWYILSLLTIIFGWILIHYSGPFGFIAIMFGVGLGLVKSFE